MIYGARVRLRPLDRHDLPSFVEWLSDPEVIQGLAIYISLSLDEEEIWYEQMLKQPKEERPLSIEAKSEDAWKLIGNTGLFAIDWRNRSAELGIFIGDKSYWDRGLGTEAVGLILQHSFSTLNLHRIFLRVYSDNPRAIKLYEKTGFVHEGRQRQAEFHGGKYHDILFMSMLRPEWKEKMEE